MAKTSPLQRAAERILAGDGLTVSTVPDGVDALV